MSATETDRTQVEDLVLETLRELAGDPDAIALDATLEAIDVDSLDLAELSQVVEEKLGVTLKGSDVAEVTTVSDAVALISSRMS